MGSKKKNKASNGDSTENGKGKQVITDPRFAKVHSDPKFQNLPKHKSKVVIDERFSGLFTDKRFAGSSAPLDKRGKPKKHTENALLRYYRQGEDDEDDEGKKRKKKLKEKDEEEEESTRLATESQDSESGSESLESESESESESDGALESDASTSTDTDDEADVSEDEDSVEVENVPVIEKETHRLAVVNMDWNHVKAVDLYMMLNSFLPNGGQIKSVSVYPSEFGLQRMKEEEVRGPAALFDDEKKDDNDDEDDNDDDEIDPEKLREYEKSRLRYYYAVVECDSVATADHLYKSCDGVEFERSSNVLDLRFIPDSMEFKHPPRDTATEASTDYDGLDFQTRALQQSDVLLSWDDDEPHRVKTLRRKFNDKQLAELELKEFLASEESESDDDEDDNEDSSVKKEKKLEMYRSLIQSGDGSEDENDDGQEMEVTFNTGLEDLSNKILEKKDRGSETVWDAYLRKRTEKKKARKSRSKNSSSDDDSDESDGSDQEAPDQPDDFFDEEPRTKKASHSKKNKDERDKAAEASRAELELLLADEKGEEDNKVKGYKIKQKKGKKGSKEVPDEDKIPAIDHDDPRFSALFSNPAFALDPTDPQFKRSAPYFRQLSQKQQKGRENDGEIESMEVPRGTSNNSVEKEEEQADRSQREKHELSSIVKSLKMKSQHLPAPSRVTSKKEKTGSNGSTVNEKKHKLPSLDRPKKKKAKV